MAAEHSSPRQIALYQTNKYLLEANDNMKPVEDGSYASNIHSPYSKIQLLAQDYTDRNNKSSASLNLDPDRLMLLANDVLSGQFKAGADLGPGKTITVYNETKILAHKTRDDGKARVTMLKIEYREVAQDGKAVGMPFTVLVENGWATAEKTASGGTQGKKGTYEKDKTDKGKDRSVKVFFSDNDFRRFLLKISKYVGYFEQAAFPTVIKLRHKFEEEQKAANQQAANQ